MNSRSHLPENLNVSNRRQFLQTAGVAAGALSGGLAFSQRAAHGEADASRKKVRIGIVGGRFGCSFQWHEHPDCEVVAVSDLRPERMKRLVDTYGCDRTFESLEKMVLAEDVEAIGIFTGAPVPRGATTVVQREWFDERAETVTLHPDAEIREGANIRRKGENGQTGEVVCRAGRPIGTTVLAAVSSCGMTSVRSRRPLRVGVLVTGDEVLAAQERPEEWSLRDSNGPALLAMLSGRPWIGRVERRHAGDQPETIAKAARILLDNNDALILTGGVSAGDHDHVPSVLADLGIETVFHKLPIRPGKPVLGAADPIGRPVLGLPGNPVSVMVTAALLTLPALRARAGMDELPPAGFVEVEGDACAPPSLTWYPLVRLQPNGKAELVAGRGSGDWIAAARSDGFIEVPPGQIARGMRHFVTWSI